MIGIISDLHIYHKDCDIIGIENMLKEKFDYFIGAGDIVDLQYMNIFDTLHAKFDLLKEIYSGLKYYIIGNHDFEFTKLAGIIENQVAMRYPSCVIMVEGQRWFITHGHYYGVMAPIFKLLERVQMDDPYRKIAKWVVNKNIMSQVSRKSNFVSESMKKAVIEEAMMKNCRVAICGHSHIPEIKKVNGLTYVNPGSALGKLSYVIYDGSKFELRGV